MGRDSGEESLSKVMGEIDANGDGQIDFEEFESWFFKYASSSEQEHLYIVYYESPTDGLEEHGQVCETTMDRLPQLLAYGVITPDTRVWMDGMDDWKTLSESSLGGQVSLALLDRLFEINLRTGVLLMPSVGADCVVDVP
eukprot:COSAG02_NODE_7843_length_2822_cov_6.232831_2_plen_140_part_00